jgi:hypothetical protein
MILRSDILHRIDKSTFTSFDWRDLRNNTADSLLATCRDLHIEISPPILKRDLIAKLVSYFQKSSEFPSVTSYPAYGHFLDAKIPAIPGEVPGKVIERPPIEPNVNRVVSPPAFYKRDPHFEMSDFTYTLAPTSSAVPLPDLQMAPSPPIYTFKVLDAPRPPPPTAAQTQRPEPGPPQKKSSHRIDPDYIAKATTIPVPVKEPVPVVADIVSTRYVPPPNIQPPSPLSRPGAVHRAPIVDRSRPGPLQISLKEKTQRQPLPPDSESSSDSEEDQDDDRIQRQDDVMDSYLEEEEEGGKDQEEIDEIEEIENVRRDRIVDDEEPGQIRDDVGETIIEEVEFPEDRKYEPRTTKKSRVARVVKVVTGVNLTGLFRPNWIIALRERGEVVWGVLGRVGKRTQRFYFRVALLLLHIALFLTVVILNDLELRVKSNL